MTIAQSGRSISDPNAYRGNLFTRLGDRNPLHVIEQTASTLADVVRTHSPAVLRARPFADKWTPNEIIGHLVDGEWVSGYRLRLTLCEDAPAILGMNQDRWVAGLQHNECDASALVDAFRAMRELNLAVWRRLSPAELERTGRHNERGPESLAVMLRMLAGHDLSHLEQLARYVQAAQQPG